MTLTLRITLNETLRAYSDNVAWVLSVAASHVSATAMSKWNIALRDPDGEVVGEMRVE